MSTSDFENTAPDPPPDFFSRRVVRWTLFIAFPLAIFILVSAAIRISQLGIDHSIFVYGQKRVVAGWPAALRVTLVDDPTGQYVLPSSLRGYLVQNGERQLIFDGPGPADSVALTRNYKVPALNPGPAELELDVRFDNRRRTVRAAVEIVAAPAEEGLTIPSDTNPKKKPSTVVLEENRAQVFTEDRGAPTGLGSVFFFRTSDPSGHPVALERGIAFSGLRQGDLPQKITTDRLGLAGVQLMPIDMRLGFTLKGARPVSSLTADETGRADSQQADSPLHPPVIHSGISAVVQNPIARADEPVRLTINQVANGGPLYADLFHQGQWIQSTSAWLSSDRASLTIDPPLAGISRVQLTTSAFASARSVAVRHFYKLAKNETVTSGLRTLLRRLTRSSADQSWAQAALALPLDTGEGFDHRLAAAFALSRLYAGHCEIPQLVYSRNEDDAELGAYKSRFQRMIMIAILSLGLGIAILVTFLGVTTHRRQARVSMMIMADAPELDTLDTPDNERRARTARWTVTIYGIVVFFALACAFISIAILVDSMTWWTK